MPKFINDSNIPLSMACWLASNSYDFNPKEKSLSATDFNKSIRQIILRNRVKANTDYLDKDLVDISSLVKSKMGTAVHDAIEQTWLNERVRSKALASLNYPDGLIKRIVVNPTKEELSDDVIPVYMEIRKEVVINGYTISGKFDFAAEGKLTDFKTTGTWKWNKLDKADEDYRRQGSIYRLIHQDILSEDWLDIVFLFTDWSKGKAKSSKNYPQSPVMNHPVSLWSLEETKQFITNFTNKLNQYKDVPEPDLPLCSPEQLWQDEPTYKYFKNPAKLTRATRVFTDFHEAMKQFVSDGSVGIVKTVYGEAKSCLYCPAYNACTQKDNLIASGTLKID